MKLFDTHCHFETCEASAIVPILVRAAEAGVAKLTAVGGSEALNAGAVAAQRIAAALRDEGRQTPEVHVALGYDREQIGKEDLPPFLSDRPVAIGEIGLDYHYSPETRRAQMELFATQLEQARNANLPVVIHTRAAADDTVSILREIPSLGIIHCFTGDPQEAKSYLDLGFFISISGIVTFKSADNVRASAHVVPDDRILIETDSPFLAPVPLRGKVNEPAFIRHTCAFLADLRGMTPEIFADKTYANGEKAFENTPLTVRSKS